jgi:hypothetical protein
MTSKARRRSYYQSTANFGVIHFTRTGHCPTILYSGVAIICIIFLRRRCFIRGLTTQAVKTTSQIEQRNVFLFVANIDTWRIGTSGSLAGCRAFARPFQLHEFVTLHVTLHLARLVYTRLNVQALELIMLVEEFIL